MTPRAHRLYRYLLRSVLTTGRLPTVQNMCDDLNDTSAGYFLNELADNGLYQFGGSHGQRGSLLGVHFTPRFDETAAGKLGRDIWDALPEDE